MSDFSDHDISLNLNRSPTLENDGLDGWTVRQPSNRGKNWAALNGLAHGLVWAFPFVMFALVLYRYGGSGLWPASFFIVGMVLLLLFLLRGLLAPHTWWYAFTPEELIVEHGILFKARDYLAFDRVQYLERRSGLIMRPMGLASLVFDTAAGRAVIPAARTSDVDVIEQYVRAAMLRDDSVL